MDSQQQLQQLQQLVDSDLRSLSNYYQEMSREQGPGVLSVNYYPSGEIAQMSAKYLKSSQISRLARQLGLINLQSEFEQHNQQTQMVVAVVTAETKGVVTVELDSSAVPTSVPETPELSTAAMPTPEPIAEPEPTIKPATKRTSKAKTTTRRKTTSTPRARRKQPKEE